MSLPPLAPGPAAAETGGDLGLPRPPGALRRTLAAHPVVVDSLIAAVYLVPVLIAGTVMLVVEPSWQGAVRLALAAVGGAALFVRRSHPWALFVIATAVLAITVFLGRDIEAVPLFFALYALAVYRGPRSAWIGFAVSSAVAIATIGIWTALATTVFFLSLDTGTLPSAIVVIALSLFFTLTGVNIGNRRRYLAALIDRAQQLARERDQQAVIAAAAERSRIAREMHDIVSHSLTVMVTLADGSARLASAAPDRSAAAMEAVAETGRSALADMRRILGVLGADERDAPEHAPQPGIGELGELVERVRAAGLPVRVTVIGRPPADPGQQLTVYRLVQESLTNALRYAALATAVVLTIEYGEERIRVTVDDDAAVNGPPGQGSGRGLIGLRERVGLYGGTLTAGPKPGGGWRLRAEFDTVHGAPAPAEVPPTATTTTTRATDREQQ